MKVTTLKQLESLMHRDYLSRRALLRKKNKDYAYSEDVYYNFRVQAAINLKLKINVGTPEGCMQYERVKKMIRQCKLVADGKRAENESVVDSIDDDMVYAELLKGLLIGDDAP